VIRTLDVSHQEGSSYAAHLSMGTALLHRAPAHPDRGALLTFTVPGSALLIGRYHAVASGGHALDAVSLHRRLTGGRVVAIGDGFLGLSLILPHRSALVSDNWLALEPTQVLNRCVRGVLHGLKALGVPVFYPGRDVITVGGRTLALISLETARTGALLFDAVIALGRDFTLVPALLDQADPGGVIKTPMWEQGQTTTVREVTGSDCAASTVAEHLAQGYATVFGLSLDGAPGGEPAAAAPAGAAGSDGSDSEEAFLMGRTPGPELDHHGMVAGQIGMLEAYFARDGERIGTLMLAGDFMANSSAVDELEATLRGVRREWATVSTRVVETFARPENFVLGLGDLSLIAEAICRGGPLPV
jgi:lipoate-protein ligase A